MFFSSPSKPFFFLLPQAILLVTVAAATALQVSAPLTATFGASPQAVANPGAPAAGAGVGNPGAAAGGAAANPGFIDYGPKVYGMGAKNPIALPPNPFSIQRAVAIANSVPNVLVVSHSCLGRVLGL